MPECPYETSLRIRPMHNFIKPTVALADALKEVKKYLHSPKKEFFASHVAQLETLYDAYDKMASKDNLHTLTPYWLILAKDNEGTKLSKKKKRHLAYELYGSERPFVNAHWEKITKENGNETLYCPICGLNECEEMDHFVPREENLYPEYSAHLSNLIPLCHSCNHKKSTKFLDKRGNRIYFNAFYDALTRRDILECSIINSPIDGMPQITTKVSPLLDAAQKPDVYILSTIDDLELLKRFHFHAKLLFKKELNRLAIRAGQEWAQIKTEFAALALPGEGEPDVVYPAVMKAMSESPILEMWFKCL